MRAGPSVTFSPRMRIRHDGKCEPSAEKKGKESVK